MENSKPTYDIKIYKSYLNVKNKKYININGKNSESLYYLNLINHEDSIQSLNDYELNNLEYKIALDLDKRTYYQYYLSLLKRKQLIIFTFFYQQDYNLTSIKFSLFLVSFSLYITINGFFFTDDTMHKIYQDNGEYNLIYQLPQIIYSSIISAFINSILKILSLSEKSILSLKNENNFELAVALAKYIKRCLIVRLVIYFILSFIFMFFFWLFISCFCAVYINTQVILIKDTLISFIVSMLYPFGLNLLPGIFRILALKDPKKSQSCMYKFSKVVALI